MLKEARPHRIFLLASLLIGLLTIVINPPLRGPDETAHFLRAFGISHGDFIPRSADARGRRGLFLPAGLHRQFAYFNQFREQRPAGNSSYNEVFAGYFDRHPAALPPATELVFVPYEGSEGYSPVPYVPYAIAAGIAEALGFDFLGITYFMRIAGLLAWVLVAAYAIATTPCLKWMFFCTAMLPGALYQRAVISVDGAVLSVTLLVVALSLKAVQSSSSGIWQRAFWMTVSSLTKPPQIAFILLEGMRGSATERKAQLRAQLLVALPGLILSLCWIIAAGADVGAWRISEGSGLPPEEFDPVWKLLFLLGHPGKFGSDVITSLDYSAELWKQLIGVFGWLDVPMRSLAYPLISGLLVFTLFDELGFDRAARWRIAIVSAFTILSYCLAVFVIFFITLTPSNADRIHGLQGRYFIVVLPLLALGLSAMANRSLGRATAPTAITCSLLSAGAMMDALWRFHWSA
jgi:uncharacterized membrane protein